MYKRRILSFRYAFLGIMTALKDEPNMQIHLLITACVISAALILDISLTDWLILIITIGLVLALELTNTAIEEIVNSFTDQQHPGAKKAKDVAAGAVLVGAITAIIVGLLVFWPYLF